MPRGRQYYDPIVQSPSKVEVTEDLSRIEMYQDEALKWWARLINPDGSLSGHKVGDFDRDTAMQAAVERWPGLVVYELRNETDDSTWDGTGPSPRIWQVPPAVEPEGAPEQVETSVTPDEQAETVRLRGLTVEAGTYLHVDDVKELLRSYAHVYDLDGNPSAGLALRTAADMLGS